ncbi:hypothetical protein [Microbacterium sp. E-13]|uniref:hypothetical protein n=1 Tax=Microbacterium sp. E-13 TaxID=3404048 RepID=UPI003CF4A8BE
MSVGAVGEPAVDVARFFKLTDRAGQGILLLFVLTQWVLAISTIGSVLVPWVSILAVLLVSASAVVVMRPGSFPLSMLRTSLVVGSAIVTTAMVTWNLPTDGWPGYAAWHLGANSLVLMALGIRGRIVQAWAAMGGMAVICVAWTVSTGQGVVAGIDLIDRHAGTLLIGTMFAVGLRPTARAIAQYYAADRRRAAQQAETEAGERERRRQTARLQAEVEPVLNLIAADQLADEHREGIRALEASLRDEIRAGALLHEPLVSSVHRARGRGIDLLLLDDSQGSLPSKADFRDAIAWAAGAVDSLERGRAVVRLRPPHHERFVSLHIEDAEHSRTLEFPVL